MSAPVTGPISIGALDLAALLCSRVCHDLISPVGAIVNGLEVLDEDKDEETKTFALDLIKKRRAGSSRTAKRRSSGTCHGNWYPKTGPSSCSTCSWWAAVPSPAAAA
jgi:hypothetical protein